MSNLHGFMLRIYIFLTVLAEEAYAGVQDGGAAAIERQLIGFFIDGLTFDYLNFN
jgi:hypothetical protein